MERAEAPSGAAKLGSARKVLQILLAFDEKRPEVSVPELAEIVATPLPTAYRHVALLKDMQLVEEGTSGRYRPTSKLLPVARAAQLLNPVAKIAAPIISEAAHELGETVMLMQQFDGVAVCIEITESTKPMRFTFSRGHTIPLGFGATGKMLLAMMTPDARALAITALGDDPKLIEAVDEVITNGYATSFGELDEGVWACSVPVASERHSGLVLTVAGPAARITSDQRPHALEVLTDAAAAVQARVGEFSV